MTVDLKNIQFRKKALLTVIAVTSVLPVLFVDLREPSASLVVLKLLAKVGAIVGTFLLFWQLVLGYRRFAATVLVDLVWVVNLHKRLGVAAVILVAFHPICITAY